MAPPYHMNTCSGGYEIYNLGRTLLGYHNFTLRLSDLCLAVKKKSFIEIMDFQYMTYIAMLKHKNTSPGGL